MAAAARTRSCVVVNDYRSLDDDLVENLADLLRDSIVDSVVDSGLVSALQGAEKHVAASGSKRASTTMVESMTSRIACGARIVASSRVVFRALRMERKLLRAPHLLPTRMKCVYALHVRSLGASMEYSSTASGGDESMR